MKNYWRRFGEWVIALKRRLFFSAGLKLTALYILNAIIILGVFMVLSGYFQLHFLREDLSGVFRPGVDSEALIQMVYEDLRASTALLVIFVLVAIGILSYAFVHMTLKPLRTFVETQRRFISDASHELRTPLATIKTENEVALLDPDSVSREEAITLIESNVEEIDRISTILNNLLSLASFNSAGGAPPTRAVDLSEISKRVLDRLKVLADRKGINLKIPDLPTVLAWGNPIALEEIVSNLVKNAIQYTPAEGEVILELGVRPREKKVEIVVKDTGVGISAKDLPHVFEPFYRSDKSLHMHQQGTGLGLPLVSQIVQRHRGSIDIQSTPGKGTTVTVLLPLALPDDAESPKPAEEQIL